jgi:hypothetical protein
LLLGALIFSSCSGGEQSRDADKGLSKMPASFEVRVDNGASFNNSSKRAKVHLAYKDMWGFTAKDWSFRIAANQLPDQGSGESTELGYNNTFLNMKVELFGKLKDISCKPASEPEGVVRRTHIDGKTVSGNFRVKFESCTDYISGQAVDYPPKPFWVEGDFTQVMLK